jgi:hypothetical protein
LLTSLILPTTTTIAGRQTGFPEVVQINPNTFIGRVNKPVDRGSGKRIKDARIGL